MFERELAAIKDETLRGFVRACLGAAPPYFWRVPASSSGKHHPAFALGEGGLVRHTKAAVAVFLEFADAGCLCVDRDACIAALILHDTLKYGVPPAVEPKTLPEHPLLPERHYAGLRKMLPGAAWEAVFSRVRAHMGRWGPVVPATPDEWLVHLADYVASRKWASGLGEVVSQAQDVSQAARRR